MEILISIGKYDCASESFSYPKKKNYFYFNSQTIHRVKKKKVLLGLWTISFECLVNWSNNLI